MAKNNFIKSMKDFTTKNSPQLLNGLGISFLLLSTGLAINATVEATKRCEIKKIQEEKDKLTKKEVFKTVWKLYIPTVISMSLSIPCFIVSDRLVNKRYTALTAALTLSETALQEYQKKAIQVIGEKKEKEVRDAISQDKVNPEGKVNKETKEILTNSDEEQLFYEPLSGRYFKSTWNKIMKACNELNEQALGSTTGAYTVNEWFEKLGLEETEMGDMLGWCTPTYGCSKGLMEIDMGATVTKDDKPCGCIQYVKAPYNIQFYN